MWIIVVQSFLPLIVVYITCFFSVKCELQGVLEIDHLMAPWYHSKSDQAQAVQMLFKSKG